MDAEGHHHPECRGQRRQRRPVHERPPEQVMLTPEHISNASAKGGSAEARSPHAWMQIRGLTKSFAGELALHEADLDISKGEIHGLVGANGAGKSTLIRCLAGVTLADSGRITID